MSTAETYRLFLRALKLRLPVDSKLYRRIQFNVRDSIAINSSVSSQTADRKRGWFLLIQAVLRIATELVRTAPLELLAGVGNGRRDLVHLFKGPAE